MSSKLKIQREIQSFISLGIDQDLAELLVYTKYGIKDAVEDKLETIKEINSEMLEVLEGFIPFSDSIIKGATLLHDEAQLHLKSSPNITDGTDKDQIKNI
jgi:oligoribonuclease (3'-5' exoribonuclease)